jgi:hypothetical protein
VERRTSWAQHTDQRRFVSGGVGIRDHISKIEKNQMAHWK